MRMELMESLTTKLRNPFHTLFFCALFLCSLFFNLQRSLMLSVEYVEDFGGDKSYSTVISLDWLWAVGPTESR